MKDEQVIVVHRQSVENELGLSVFKPDDNATKQGVTKGLQITYIKPGSDICRNGNFKIGDIITEIDFQPVADYETAHKKLKKIVSRFPKTALVLKILRLPKLTTEASNTTNNTLHQQNGTNQVLTNAVVSNGTNHKQILNQNQNNLNHHKQTSQNTLHPITPTSPSKNINNGTMHAQSHSSNGMQQHTRQHSHNLHKHTISSNSMQPPSTPSSISQIQNEMNVYENLATRKMGFKHNITVRKGKHGFGIKIAERDNMHGYSTSPIYITAITSNGSAHLDGRLKEGDILLEVNGMSLVGKSQHEVTSLLTNIATDAPTEFIVSRHETNKYEDKTLTTANDYDQGIEAPVDNKEKANPNQIFETYTFDIPLNHTNTAGLGLSLAYEIDKKTRRSIRIYAMNILTEGAAWKDGRLRPGDQILSINGISPVGLTKEQASETLNAAVTRGVGPKPDIIRLTVKRQLVQANESSTSRSSNSDINESTASPHTHSSSSNKLSYDSTTNKTNDNSSSTSQMNDMTTMATNGSVTTPDIDENYQSMVTCPKTIDYCTEIPETNNSDTNLNSLSCDEGSVNHDSDSFLRDGFGRQSISEKRIASLNAKNTDTFRRNQLLREEKERLKQVQCNESNNINLKNHQVVEQNHIDQPREIQYQQQNQLVQPQNTYFFSQNMHQRVEPEILVDSMDRSSSLHSRQSSQPTMARNRRMNESFRAAVDRSYEIAVNDTNRLLENSKSCDSKVTSNDVSSFQTSGSNLTSLTASEYKPLVRSTFDHQGNSQNGKRASLLSRFLKFGSIKKRNKSKTSNSVEDYPASYKSREQLGDQRVVTQAKSAELNLSAQRQVNDPNLHIQQVQQLPNTNQQSLYSSPNQTRQHSITHMQQQQDLQVYQPQQYHQPQHQQQLQHLHPHPHPQAQTQNHQQQHMQQTSPVYPTTSPVNMDLRAETLERLSRTLEAGEQLRATYNQILQDIREAEMKCRQLEVAIANNEIERQMHFKDLMIRGGGYNVGVSGNPVGGMGTEANGMFGDTANATPASLC